MKKESWAKNLKNIFPQGDLVEGELEIFASGFAREKEVVLNIDYRENKDTSFPCNYLRFYTSSNMEVKKEYNIEEQIINGNLEYGQKGKQRYFEIRDQLLGLNIIFREKVE